MPMRKALLTLAVVVAVAALLRFTVLTPEKVEVRVIAAAHGRVEATVANSKAGTIEARRRAKLSTGTSGIVVDLPVKRGQRVSAGELLLALDDATQVAALEVAREALRVAEATHKRTCVAADRAARELERNQKLAEQQYVSVDLLDGLQSAHELAIADCSVAAARVDHAKASTAAAQAELDKTRLFAPFEAIIAEVSVEMGEWVTPSVALLAAPELVDAIDPTSLYISAPMDEVDAAALRTGLAVRVSIDPYPDQSFPGKLVLVAPYVLDLEQQNRTIEVEVELEDAEFSASLVPGTSADVEVILDVAEDVLRVPAYTLLEGGRVMVLPEGGRLEERELTIGLRNWEWVEVLDGLSEGERVVTNVDHSGVKAGASAVVAED